MIFFEFGQPEVKPGLWKPAKVTVVPMPKTAVEENHLLIFRKNEIWLTGQRRDMESVSVSECVDQTTNGHLTLAIFVFDKPHPLAAFGRGQCVGHRYNII
jgi:hypothetical protein